MMSRLLFTSLFVGALALAGGCAKSEPPKTSDGADSPASTAADADSQHASAAMPESGVDYHSLANTGDYRVQHLDLDLTVDFERKVLEGEAVLQVERLTDENPPLVLDTRDLEIEQVKAGQGGDMAPVKFRLGEKDSHLGAPLEIQLPPEATSVSIAYRTSPGASGVQWLEPRQTAGKKHPFLFTQAQPTHARSFVPLQDSPQVRITYKATIRTPKALRAVMSANNDPKAEKDGVYEFEMPQPIPSYLIALAVGDLEFKPMGERTGVYAEKVLLDAAAKEFEDTESMLEATEKVYGPYRWDRYDLLILPPSFPFGGMENPRLSFITPTVIAGDKSLVALIAHELAHSWSGNLVTNASWRDLWLNEGFTTYLTNRIMQLIYGDERYRMEMALGYDDLQADLADRPDKDEIMAIDLRGRDPDEAFSNIPYEKGSLFLYELEQKVGRENFDRFLLDYFNHFSFQSITTEDFLAYLEKTLLKQYPDKLDAARVRQWIYEPGIPEGAPHPMSDAFSKLDPVRQQWLDGKIRAGDIDTQGWTFHQWKYFLDGMPEKLSAEQLKELDAAFGLTESKNNEVAFSWLMIAVRNDYQPAYARLESFLTGIGRNKFVRPLYRAMVETGKKDEAARIFENAKAGYHPLTVKVNSRVIYGDEQG
ncbi:M1 family metallopeptidase [Microbulbifer thermotolerans]|uniref:M1 family metallopeptidase n=1 Tax=Microbulbifer thermotolerans TaxID=252514 RepID=UPI0008E4B0FF|nr:M1 family metallopeptidase [Microbulbifer thermotolerans]MCX2781989.1 M1 family metallopeptidase [Microbulbifer thermotolerans]MCX2783253.1 M1 family metallopeptidase [Microbulbifer thermotolerans]MCX2834020.1 M1 family metallopeptidase [Microbulbifer thermotolerans]WKT60926.1 M1 family metallopeptidase [Microbulbifer thermotolerans]SFC38408.1 leukotriene A-4 hydrolase/aminopeptidase [Microbulbifer thermotolerans]